MNPPDLSNFPDPDLMTEDQIYYSADTVAAFLKEKIAPGGDPTPSPEIRFLGELQRLTPQPGDVFVLTVEKELAREQRESLIALWERAMPGHKALILHGGLKVGIIGGEEA